MTEFGRSKLPDVGTTIFTVMSRRARELGALNLGQGFPDYDIDPRIGELLAQAVREGHNQYAPMEGSTLLRQVIAAKLKATYEVQPDWEAEITVTVGATEAIYSAIQAVVGAGDEVIVFDPAYDSYDPAVRLAGGRCVHIPLQPPMFAYDWGRVAASITPRARLIIINSPHNPSCTAAQAADLDALATLIRDRDILVLSDEVYEHVMYDGRKHHSVLAHAELAARAFVVFSFGKTLHATGWRVGYCIAPPALTVELRRFTSSIPLPSQLRCSRLLPSTCRKSRRCGASCPDSSKESAICCVPGWPGRRLNCRRRRVPFSSCSISPASPQHRGRNWGRRPTCASPNSCSSRRAWRPSPCRHSMSHRPQCRLSDCAWQSAMIPLARR